ncbi:5' nucleotidase [Culex quinquefasciatus]|uniref:Apyrase n=1 Tax=Culex quinquefasciatus TaxID=7176 RepID=B0XGC3_CULQU|nr:5' nucleotidase [Culex quinquefasciatus]|eukprot:XP_001868695.1 5' nucleotidase [Culex quinquefasciatus]
MWGETSSNLPDYRHPSTEVVKPRNSDRLATIPRRRQRRANQFTTALVRNTMSVGQIVLVLTAVAVSYGFSQELFPLSIIHVNDFHARFDETNYAGTVCNPEVGDVCIGGYARTVTAVKELLATRENAIFLNAGDNFQGTLWYNLYRWNVTSRFLNMLPADAMTIGNHEFDNGVAGVVPFLETINSTILLCNVDRSDEPEFVKYEKSMRIERGGKTIGIIGVILQSTSSISSSGKLRFLDEPSSVKAEAQKLKDEGIDIIIVLSHCGVDVDKRIAAEGGENIDIIVGGHSHSFLYSGDNPGIPGTIHGDYPTVVTQQGGHRVLIVQAAAYTKLVGDIVLYFDDQGIIQRWDGNPYYLGPEVIPDREIHEALIPWKQSVDELGNRIVGATLTDLPQSGCNFRECALGNLISDAYVDSCTYLAEPGHWTYAAIGLSNTGVELRGDRLLQVLEHGASNSNIQISGLQVVYNMTEPRGSRVQSVNVRCSDCLVPRYDPLDPFKYYRVAANSHMTGGGGGYTMFEDFGRNKVVADVDINALERFVQKRSPLLYGLEGRVTVVY